MFSEQPHRIPDSIRQSCRGRFRLWLLAAVFFCPETLTCLHAGESDVASATKRPNVVLILADDLGYSDLGCYGSNIATPTLDSLAKNGLRFNSFYNTARCWPTRAALLTGYYAQQVNRDKIPGSPKRPGNRPSWAPLLSEMLSTAGYRTYHSGKWHLDKRPGTGFDRSFSVEDHDRFFSPKRLLLDGQAMPDLTDSTTRPDGFYVTDAIGDYATQFLTSHLDDQADEPFFAYVAFTSPHFPLQAPSETIDTYASQFDEGWDAVRKQRLAKMRSDGLLDTTMSPLEPEIGPPYRFNNLGVLDGKEIFNEIPWSTLTDSQRQFQAAKMRIHAAMIDRMDQQIGRIVTLLRQREVLDDTLILFLSDNGASAEIMIRGDGHDPSKPLGADGSYVCLGPGWSTASNTPFRRHKTWVHEGGISTPLIVSWPNGLASSDEASATVENARQGQSGPITNQVGHVVDVVPTILEACNVPIPKFPVESTTGSPTESTRESPAMRPGTSLLSQFRGGPIIDRELWWCHDGHRAMRQGKWKAIADSAPNGNRLEDAQWHLYDLSTDRTEQRDLAKEEPEQLKTLVEQWTQRIEAMR